MVHAGENLPEEEVRHFLRGALELIPRLLEADDEKEKADIRHDIGAHIRKALDDISLRKCDIAELAEQLINELFPEEQERISIELKFYKLFAETVLEEFQFYVRFR